MSEKEQEEHSKYQTFLIFGAPGSGKGIQGRQGGCCAAETAQQAVERKSARVS
ncbi:MAG: hypothetical protein HRU47_08160 [Verrucomicrobiales bacterium]|nr:hypothetical protein [Verrucomicrobiales bacterium]